MLFNLLSNAIKYNNDNGSIEILITATKESYIRISIKDTGIGIPEKKISELFKPFSRLGAEDSQIEGAGIGLVISQKLIRLMHGRIFLDSTNNQGSTFCIEIPRTVLFANSGRKVVLPQNFPALNNNSQVGKKTILYVEDNEVNALLMRKIFVLKDEIELIICETGTDAERICASQKVDLVLLDLNLKDETGYDVLVRLRKLPGYAHVNIIAVSADAMPNELKKSSEAGFSHYVTKPLNIPLFLRLVNEHLFPAMVAE